MYSLKSKPIICIKIQRKQMYVQGNRFYSDLLLSHALLLKKKSAVRTRQLDNFFLTTLILLEACGDPGCLLPICIRLREDGKIIYEPVFQIS